MKAYWGSGVIAPYILRPRPLYPEWKIPWYPFYRRLGGPQNRSGRGGEEKNSQPLPGLEPPIIQPVAQRYTTELSQLTYKLIGIEFCISGLHLFCSCLQSKITHMPYCVLPEELSCCSQLELTKELSKLMVTRRFNTAYVAARH
jgi:hypothetical protein